MNYWINQRTLPVAIIGTMATIVLVQSPLSANLSAPEVSKMAMEIVVRIDGQDTGTGVIIGRQGNNYTVLTNWHVVNKSGSILFLEEKSWGEKLLKDTQKFFNSSKMKQILQSFS